MSEVDELIDEWFETHTISILNIYVISLIIVEQNCKENKSNRLEDAIQFVSEKLLKDEKIENCEIIRDEIIEEIETLEVIKELLFECCNNPNLLQKDKFWKKEENKDIKLLLCRPVSSNNFKFGQINK